jgi:hypothetical protein
MAYLTKISFGVYGMRRIRTLGRLLLICSVLAALTSFRYSLAQPVDHLDATERQVKAAYLSKFGSYVEWPDQTFANSGTALKIGVIGADALADDLIQMVAGRTINERTVSVHKLHSDDAIADINVLFIGNSAHTRLNEILTTAKALHVLTVTESEEAYALGSMINFIVVGGKVRFEVAPKSAKPANLTISARLLAAAYKVAAGGS